MNRAEQQKIRRAQEIAREVCAETGVDDIAEEFAEFKRRVNDPAYTPIAWKETQA